MSSFKIIETIEKGERKIAAVPSGWESNGELMWPPPNKLNKLIKNASRPPGTIQEGWKKFSCVVVQSNINSMYEARDRLRNMSDFTETSGNEGSFVCPPAETIKKTSMRSVAARKIFTPVNNADANRNDYNEVNIFANYE